MVYPLISRFPTIGPHSESQVEVTLAGEETITLSWMPQTEDEAFLPFKTTFFDTEPDVFRITGDHAFMKRHTIKVTEDLLLDGWNPIRIIVVTRHYPLTFTIANLTTVQKFLGATIHHYAGPRERILTLADKLEQELRGVLR